jgi:hypothetical protein
VKIRMAFRWEPNGGDTPWLVAAVDELTEEEWGRLPDFYTEELEKDPANTRELIVDVPSQAIYRLIDVPTVAGNPV